MGHVSPLIFRTSINSTVDLHKVNELFVNVEGIMHWSVDMEDWEKILRIETRNFTVCEIIAMLRTQGISAKELND
jgi:hypothetical protein